MILNYRDKATEQFAKGEYVKAFHGFEDQAARRLSILNAAHSLDTLRALPGNRREALTNMRVAINAILYLLRTGCPWRYIPRGGFPPRSTVYNIFRSFQKAGTWDATWEQLYMDLREDMGREASAAAVFIDSQSLKFAEKGAVMTV